MRLWRVSNVWPHRERLAEPLLQCAQACVIIKFDLPPAKTTYYAPAVTLCKLAHLCIGHSSQNTQLRRLRNNVFRSARQCLRDFRGESWKSFVHGLSV